MGVGIGIKVMGKWEWKCSVLLGMGGNGNGNESMGVEREWEQENHSRTPLLHSNHAYNAIGVARRGAVGAPAPPRAVKKIFSGLIYWKNV